MIVLKFFYTPKEGKLPIKAVRKDKAFVNESLPHLFAFLIRSEKDESRRPAKELWNGLHPKEFRLGLVYPKIDENAWFTYEKNGDDKVKRLPLAEYLKRKGR